MKKLLFVIAAACMTVAVAAGEKTKNLKILMIGNSFSICVGHDLYNIVKNTPDCKMTLVSAYIGGCTLQQHWKNIERAEKNPKLKLYAISTWDTERKVPHKRDNVKNLLKENWDIITIQQGSHQSWDYKYFEPYAEKLIKYIRKHAPKAEIVIQQTWSYRVDDSRMHRWKISQTQMYEKLHKAYSTLAKNYGLRVIPTGDAVQITRKAEKIQSTPPTAKQNPKLLKRPALPSYNNDIVGRSRWYISKKTKKWTLSSDPSHLSRRGNYLQACVWFCTLFGKTAEDIKYTPKDIEKQDAANLRSYAQQAVKGYKQVTK